ncbi:MAG: cytochrome c peroxidase [Gammaproteobacteria bacterium]
MKKLSVFCCLLLVWTGAFSGEPARNPVATQVLAPGYQPLTFEAPSPGSYSLPVIGRAADGQVVDSGGNPHSLLELYGNKIVVLSFIYSTCSDVNGCPLATAVLQQLKSRLRKQPEILDRLRLLTLSFNPDHDTPDVMRAYGANLRSDELDWRFLTTRSEAELQPILRGYRQPVSKNLDDKGQFLGTYSHLLRVYLIDGRQQIRNIYSVSFLHADTLVNDIKTLLLEQAGLGNLAGSLKAEETNPEDAFHDSPLGLPAMPFPIDNPPTAEKIVLGKKLFFDRRLSLNDTMSCAMCHIPNQGFTNNEMATSVGLEGRTGRRNAPTLYNVGYLERLFHDGRESTLEQQIWGPLLAANEMGNPSVGYVIDKINRLEDYQGLFEEAFRRRAGMETVGMAIASFERTLNSANSPFDRWRYGKQANALPSTAKKGFELFTGKARCSVCHTVTGEFALFTDNKLHNTGVGYEQSMSKRPLTHRITIAPGVSIDVESDKITAVSGGEINDLGLYEITQNPDDRWKYKTPSLRNIALTGPYMHNGQMNSLEQVVRFYNRGGFPNPGLSPLITPLGLNDKEIAQLVEFLNSLTGDNITHIEKAYLERE